MTEITYLPEVECRMSKGFLESLVEVGIQDEKGKYQYLQVGKGQVAEYQGKQYLAVGIVDLDYARKRALIELPQEADSGTNRLWVPFSAFRQESKTL